MSIRIKNKKYNFFEIILGVAAVVILVMIFCLIYVLQNVIIIIFTFVVIYRLNLIIQKDIAWKIRFVSFYKFYYCSLALTFQLY